MFTCSDIIQMSNYFFVSSFLVTVWPVSLDTLEGKIPGVGAGSQKQSSGHI